MTSTSPHTEIFKGLDLETGVRLDRFTSFRVGGPADFLSRPGTVDELTAVLKATRDADIPVTVLGGGSNTLISDRGIRGMVIVLTRLKTGPERLRPEPDGPDGVTRVSAMAVTYGRRRRSSSRSVR